MKIKPNPSLPTAQPQVLALVAEALAKSVAPPGLKGLRIEEIVADTPHAVLELSLQQLANAQGLKDATRTGMRYVVRSVREPDAVMAVADVGIGRIDPTQVWARSLSHGVWLSRLGSALKRAEDYPTPERDADAELALLRCPAFNLEALVLRPASGGGATLFPFIGTVPGLQGGALTEAAFFDALWPQAPQVQQAFAAAAPDREPLTG